MISFAEIQERDHRFYAAMGRCIAKWASIEVRLFHLFTTALGARQELCGLVFWAIPSFSMRLSYTSSLVNECLADPPPGLAKSQASRQKWWDDLRADLATEYGFRNRLAHQHTPQNRTETFTDENGDQTAFITLAVVDRITPNPFDPKQKFPPILEKEIVERGNKANDLDTRLDHFNASFSSWRYEKYSLQDHEPQTDL